MSKFVVGVWVWGKIVIAALFLTAVMLWSAGEIAKGVAWSLPASWFMNHAGIDVPATFNYLADPEVVVRRDVMIPIKASWYSKVIDDDERTLCLGGGTSMITPTPSNSWRGKFQRVMGGMCRPIPGTYRMEITYKFMVYGFEKTLTAYSNKFQIVGEQGPLP